MRFWSAIGLGMTIISLIAGGTAAGLAIDRLFATGHAGVIAGSVLGTITALLWLYKLGAADDR